MARRGRTQGCSTREARSRRGHARKFLEVAEIAASEQDQIDLKDAAHYGFFDISRPELRKALRQAGSLLRFADDVLGRE